MAASDPSQEMMAIMVLKKSPVEHFRFEQTFGSTAGPFGGIGGASITTFVIDAYRDDEGNAVLFCQGRMWKKVKDFRCQGSWQ